ncbi:DUF3397 domain-containing protein [Aquibacillus saliphilus]|uniref:DUF3397 domain-containing protein n=1 Tax=Aquibacillus saliphilus TaxID=1909422 RepID=UPI001CEFDA8B|nr:DUF3397 domain-containing protein [Aquibacillus saliphilus]
MIDIISYLVEVIIYVPILITIITYVIAKKVQRNNWKAIHISVNYSTLLYIISVGMLLDIIFNRNFFSIIIIVLLIMLSISVIVQWKVKEEILFRYVWKGFWRCSFLLFGFSYIGLIIIGIARYIMEL